jgi:hypothetical protein
MEEIQLAFKAFPLPPEEGDSKQTCLPAGRVLSGFFIFISLKSAG